MRTCLLLCIVALTASGCYASDSSRHERFDEQLTLQSLPDGKLLTHFKFTTHSEAKTASGTSLLDYGLFPKAVGQVLQEYAVDEMHLTFSQGRWNYDIWGFPPEQSSGTGVELWAWMESSANLDARWKSLTNTLSGLFCASLNFIDETLTTEPVLSFRRDQDQFSAKASNNSASFSDGHLRYGSLPHENVCTENLTPWIKLLPCKSKSGIAALLNPHRIYNSNFHSMSIHAKSMCKDDLCKERVLDLKQTVTSVLDPVRDTGRRDWSLQGIFERVLHGACPLAQESQVLVDLQQDRSGDMPQLSPVPDAMIENVEQFEPFLGLEGRKRALYDLHHVHESLDVRTTWDENMFHYPPSPSYSMVAAHRYFTGYGQERGGLRITFHNRDRNYPMPVTYYDSIPWFLKLYLHTLKVEVLNNQSTDKTDDIIQQMYYQPAVDRSRPSMLECELILPPESTVTMSLEFDKVFLKYTEHRPDANRGFDVGPAVLTAHVPLERMNRSIRIYTDTLLVSLPTPDFSMPYNVITLTCTVIALFFGSLFNLLTRSFQVVEPSSPIKE